MSWESVKLAELAKPKEKGIKGGPFGSKLTTKDYVDDGVPVIRGSNLNGGKYLDESEFVYVTESKFHEDLSSNVAYKGDLLFTQRGTLGQVAIIPETSQYENYVISQSQMKMTVDEDLANPSFIYYFFSSKRAIKQIENLTISSGVPHINLGLLRSFEVKLPSLQEQNEIVSILSAYDNLIQNNKRRIELLEKSARLLYKEWFVQLRFPGHEHKKIADGVPDGWEKLRIGDVFDTTSGGTPSRKNPEYFTGDINWAKTQELNEGYLFETEEKITEQAINNSSAKLFPSETLLVSIYGGTNIGRSTILANPSASNQACVALWPNHPAISNYYGQLFFQYKRSYLIGLAQGAAQTNISQKVLKSVDILVPTESLHDYFLTFIEPIYKQIKRLQLSLNHLIRARDLLLSKLINGDIPV